MTKEEIIDFKGILYKFFSRWYLFIIATIVAYLSAKVYIKYQESVYRVSTTVLIRDESKSAKHIGGLDMFSENKNLYNEIGLIRSFDMVMAAIRKLDFDVSYFFSGDLRTTELYNDRPFTVILDTSSFQVINTPFFITILPDKKVRLQAEINSQPVYDLKNNTIISYSKKIIIDEVLKSGQAFKNENISFTIIVENPYFIQKDNKLYFIIQDRNVLTQSFKRRLSVYPIDKESSIIELAISGPLVEKDILFLNKLTEVYIQSGLEEKNKITTNTINFIDEQLVEISRYLKETEGEMESFRKSNKVVDLGNEALSHYNKLEGLEEEKGSLELNLKYYNYLLDYISTNQEISEIVAPSAIGIPDPQLGILINELINRKSERKLLSANTTEKNPYISKLDLKIQNTTENLLENINTIRKKNQISLTDLNGRIALIEKLLNKLPHKERMLMDLQRKFNLNDHLYNFLLERRAEAGITKASNKADNQILDKANILNAIQIAPKTDLIFTSCFMLGLVIPFLLIIIYDFLNDRILSREELEKHTNIPVIGTIGHNNESKNIAVSDNPKSAISEMFRTIRINLQYLAADKSKKVIGITSSISGEGKTFCSINLATIIAMSGKKTLLLGTDLRKPKIFDDFNLSNSKGLSTYLSNQHTIEEVIFSSHIENLDLITGGPIPPNPSELLSSARMVKLIEELKKKYDNIIVDSAPLGIISDYLVLTDLIDITLYVVRYNYTTKKNLSKVNELYDSGKIKNFTLLINDIKGMVGSYYYGYSYSSYGYYQEEKKGIISQLKNYLIKKRRK